MTADREQTRRDAERLLNVSTAEVEEFGWPVARHCLTLLAELAQAERERDEARGFHANCERLYRARVAELNDAEARLEPVPALVDDAIQLCDQHISDEQRKETQRRIIEWASVWEQDG